MRNSYSGRSKRKADLQCHQQTFAFDICKAKIDAAWVAVGIAIAHNVFNLSVDAVDETVGQLFDAGVISLFKNNTSAFV